MKAERNAGWHPFHRTVVTSVAAALLAIGALVAAAPSASRAQEAGRPDVRSYLTAKKILRDADGRETQAPADEAKPFDTLEYRARYENVGLGAARGLMATLPIPAGMELVSGSALPEASEGSLDGTTFEPLPLLRPVKRADGSVVMEPVPAREIRALRWNASELAAGDSFVAVARVRISGPAPAAEAPAPK